MENKNVLIKLIAKIFLIVLETIVLLILALYLIMLSLCKGPSETARNLFVHSVKETSAIGFLADIYLSDQEISEIMSEGEEKTYSEVDTSLINFADSSSYSSTEPDAYGMIDEDGDGIIIEEVKGSTFSGYMMIVKDPSRLIMGSVIDKLGTRGYTVEELVNKFGAVAGTNGGGFVDDQGMGDGSLPDTMIVFNGEQYYMGTRNGFVGIDENYVLHVDCQSSQEIADANIKWGCCYGPILVNNGEIVVDSMDSSGLNPRTAIGQRADGAILLLVIDGRHIASLGATILDEAEIMIKYGAINAGNMDGGSSALMYYNDEYVNNKAAVIGIRNIPTSWLILPQGVEYEELED